MTTTQDLLHQIQTILTSAETRQAKAEQLAAAIRLYRDYRWVGLYDVTATEIAIIAWSGPGAPAYPRFPVSQGLSGQAVASRRSVVCNDVANDPRYLTAFGSTQAEIIIPVIQVATQTVVGTVDVESEQKNAFTDTDQALLEACARAATGLWESPGGKS